MDFLDAVNQGLEKATAAQQAILEVDEAFKNVNVSLEQFPLASISIERGISQSQLTYTLTRMNELISNIRPEYHSYDSIFLVAKHREGEGREKRKIASWKQHVNGFPCIIGFDGEKQTCSSGEDLTASFGELFASVGFGKALLELIGIHAVGGVPGKL